MRKHYSIGIMGTSLITSVKDRNWCVELQKYLRIGKSSLVHVYAYGSNGAQSTWGVANIGGLIRLRPNAYIIEFINDALPDSLSVSQSVANYTTIVNSIRDAHPDATIFFMALVRPTADGKAEWFPNLDDYDLAHKNLATTLGIDGFIDTRAAWGDPALHPEEFPPGDGVHPYLAGYVRAVLPTIKAALDSYIE